MHRRTLQWLLLTALMAPGGAAIAAFHFMKVVEVYAGSPAAPQAQYVQLQMYAAGQNRVSGHRVSIFASNGQLINHFTFGSAVGNASNQSTILIATPEAAAFFSINADLPMTAVIDAAGGKACFDAIPEDCVAWGSFSGSATGVGTPFNNAGLPSPANPAVGLQAGRAAFRRLDISGGASTLEAADDTDDSANDFRFGSPLPRNNAGTVGSIPASTCGNSLVESLEQCDDGNLFDRDGCSSVCLIDVDRQTIFIDGFEPE